MSLRDKYTPEEWDALENEISQKKNKKNASLDMYELLKPIEKTGIKYEENEADKKELGDLLNYSIEYAKITDESYNSENIPNYFDDEVLKFNKLEQNINTEFERRKGRDILDIITHKVYEKKTEGKCPEAAILSYNDYHDLGVISDFHLDYITVMGCKLKIHVSLNAEDGNVEIY